jgi:hypothetical protein
MKRLTKKHFVLWAVFLGVVSMLVAVKSNASPILPAPNPNGGPTCSTYVYFDGMMGCLPMFHTAMVCQ